MPAWTGRDVKLNIGAARKTSCGKAHGGIGTDSIVLVADPQADSLVSEPCAVNLLGRDIQGGELAHHAKVGDRSEPSGASDAGIRRGKVKGTERAA